MKTRIGAMKVLLTVLVVMVGMSLVSGCAEESKKVEKPAKKVEKPVEKPLDDQTAAGEQAIVDACTTCHSAARIYLQPDSTDWAAVIDRMVETHMKASMFGDTISAEQKQAIITFMMSRTKTEGEQVVRGKCTGCHDLARLTAKPVDTDWQTVVDRMTKAHGLVLTAEEQAQVLEFLANR